MKNFLLRKEIFGGTLFSISSGKRSYVNKEEFAFIEAFEKLPPSLESEMNEKGSVKIVCPKILPKNNFSFSDTIFFEITRLCNLSCIHCFNDSGQKISDELSIYEKKQIIRSSAACGAQELRLTGGEPVIVDKLCCLIEEGARGGLRVSMGTNGTLITHEKAKMLSKSGLKMAIVSIDGMEKYHDDIRGNGSFQKALSGIFNLMNQEIKVRINIVAMKNNITDIPRVVQLFHDIGVEVFIRRFIPKGRALENKNRFALELYDYDFLKKELWCYLQDPRNIIQGHYLKEIISAPRLQLPFKRNSCSVGQRAFVIAPNGEIQLCGFLSPDKTGVIGNLKTSTMEQIWKNIVSRDFPSKLSNSLKAFNSTKKGMETNCHALACSHL